MRLLFDRALGLCADRPPSGVVVDGEIDTFFWLDRLQTPFAEWAAAGGGSALEVHLYGRRAARAAGVDDVTLRARVLSTIEGIWPGLSGRCLDAVVERNAATHTTFPPGTFSRLPAVSTPVPNVAL